MKTGHLAMETFISRVREALGELQDSYQASATDQQASDSSPGLLGDTFEQLFDAMQRTEFSLSADSSADHGNQAGAKNVTELGEYALELLDQALDWSKKLGLEEVFQSLQWETINMARWIAACGGEIFSLEPVVDALARHANHTQQPGELLELFRAMSEIMEATAGAIRQDLEKTNPGRPWRVLQLNRAIVATRTHQPDIMEKAFAELVQYLPEDAPGFFSTGMEQMDLLNYPPHVREVMDRYYRKWSVDRSLH